MQRFEVPLIEDSAEALGATHRGRAAGSFGVAGIFSFNGNKIITTSGGGMLVTQSPQLAERARHLATQAREPFSHYEHTAVGFNYRLSNLLAALGRAQLRGLDGRVERRKQIDAAYVKGLAGLPGISPMPRTAAGHLELLADLHPDRSRDLRGGPGAACGWPSRPLTSNPDRPGNRFTSNRPSPGSPSWGPGTAPESSTRDCACRPGRRSQPADQSRVDRDHRCGEPSLTQGSSHPVLGVRSSGLLGAGAHPSPCPRPGGRPAPPCPRPIGPPEDRDRPGSPTCSFASRVRSFRCTTSSVLQTGKT